MSNGPKLILSTSPYQKRAVDTPRVMRHVLYSLIPAMGAALYLFGVSALLVVLSCVFGAVLTEWLLQGRGDFRTSTVSDGSAVLTAVLLALTLPPGLPLWMAFVGGVVAILAGKVIFGGLGYNIFNPSLTGRAFLQASFPEALTTWQTPQEGLHQFFQIRGATFTPPLALPQFDGVTAATPLAQMKFEHLATKASDLFLGAIPGSIGETSVLMIVLGGAYLVSRRFLDWRIPVGMVGTVFLAMYALHLVSPDRFPTGTFHVLSGGLMLGAVYMATDPVTSPVTPKGTWLFAILTGLLIVAIREFGGLPEGVMYAILLANALVPLMDRYTQPRIYGAVRTERGTDPA